MSVYIPLATKYRPQRFSDVIGQDITVRIITNGMLKNRLGAAMLFSGTRGIGKTTIARIVAKAFRCENPTPEPCGKCASCLSFSKGSQMDVIEIDAASNTGVDDVREIIESCRYKPTSGKFKIFIIDEVHMLSNSAFNALLKTLEEPPEHVKFLMATTETYKIPETILSRVIKFDLRPIEANVLAQHLSSVCNQEGITAGADVLMTIAKAADGSIRDSLSILDQVINMTDKNEIHLEDVRGILGMSDDSDLVELLKLILAAKVKEAVEKLRGILHSNVSCEKIASSCLDYIHAMTCMKNGVGILSGELDEVIIPKLEAISQTVSISALTRIWQMLLRGIEETKISDRPEIVLEMLIVRIAYASGFPDLSEIIEGSRGSSGSNGSCGSSGSASISSNSNFGTADSNTETMKSTFNKSLEAEKVGQKFTEKKASTNKSGTESVSRSIDLSPSAASSDLSGNQSQTADAANDAKKDSDTLSIMDEALKIFPGAIVE